MAIIPHDAHLNSAVVEIFTQGDMAPPVTAHHDAERPIYTVSLQSSQQLVLGQKIRTPCAGVFESDVHVEVPQR